jgi:hypothetical protein
MIYSFSKSIILTVVLFVFSVGVTAQIKPKTQTQPKSKISATPKVSGAYGGILLLPGLNGMTITTYTYYFRPDGTYATEFDKPDWKTRVDGTYTLKGRTITLSQMSGNKPDTMEIKDDGNLDDSSYTLHKLSIMNSVPAKRLENKSANSVGGMGTGMNYVGVFSNRIFIFDGKGSFSNDDSGSVAVIGENIGGGTSKNDVGGGTYTIKDSVLTLTYKNGKTDTRSFFYAEKPEVMALINGSFYYEYDDEKGKDEPSKLKTGTKETSSESAPDGLKILRQANAAHGGAKLDNLKTLRMTGSAFGLDLTMLVDVVNRKIRYEFRKDGNLAAVEQLDGNDGWQWVDKKKSPLTGKRQNELKKSFDTGLLGLRSSLIKSISVQSAEIKKENNIKTVIVEINGEKYGMIFDAENRLVGEVSVEDGVQQTTISKDFRNTNGVVLPYSSTVTSGTQNLTVVFSSIEVNPAIDENSWAAPEL